MSAQILDGKAFALKLRDQLKVEVAMWHSRFVVESGTHIDALKVQNINTLTHRIAYLKINDV